MNTENSKYWNGQLIFVSCNLCFPDQIMMLGCFDFFFNRGRVVDFSDKENHRPEPFPEEPDYDNLHSDSEDEEIHYRDDDDEDEMSKCLFFLSGCFCEHL